MTQDFTEKLRSLVPYCDRFETITFFELTQYFGQSLFLVLIWLSSLPLFIFSAEWIVLPLSALIMMCSIWYFFDSCLWLPDVVKAQTIASQSVKQAAVTVIDLIDRYSERTGPQSQFAPYWVALGPLSVACMIIAAFLVGLVGSASYLPVFCLFCLPIGLLLMDFYLSSIGCLFLLLEAIRAF